MKAKVSVVCRLKTLRLDSIVMNLFNITMSYLGEFSRAYKAVGNYLPKTQYKKRRPGFNLPSYAYWPEEKFLEKFRENYDLIERPPQETNTVGSAKALARLACEMNYVALNSQSLCFTVTGPFDGKKATVEEDDEGRLLCSCEGPGLCFRKEAYLIVTKKVMKDNCTTYKLSTLRRKTRNTKGPSGRKKIAPINVNNVIPAPDSRAAQRSIELQDRDSSGSNERPLNDEENLATATATSSGDEYEDSNAFNAKSSTPVLKRSRIEVQHQSTSISFNRGSKENARQDHHSESPLQRNLRHPTDFCEFQDSEDEDARMGLHFYSPHSLNASIASRVSTTGTYLSFTVMRRFANFSFYKNSLPSNS